MEKIINDEFILQIVTEQAWKELSGNFTWTETLLEKFYDKVDWKLISENRSIRWTLPMLNKFSRRVDWKALSQVNTEWFTEAHLEAFKDKWDWSELVHYYNLTEKQIDKYIDYINWEELIGVGCSGWNSPLPSDDNFDAIAFYEKYKQHIPMSKFQDSLLWERIVEQKCRQLKAEIMS